MIAGGGALGGAAVALVAPLVFSGYWELHVALAASSGLVVLCWVVASRRAGWGALGTNELEKLFGTLRRTCPGLVFDLLQLLERIKAERAAATPTTRKKPTRHPRRKKVTK